MIVLELCICSLKSQCKPENAPARLRDEIVRRKVLSWAQQILDALRYIHSEGFVHRDLKLDNVLVSYPKYNVDKSTLYRSKILFGKSFDWRPTHDLLHAHRLIALTTFLQGAFSRASSFFTFIYYQPDLLSRGKTEHLELTLH